MLPSASPTRIGVTNYPTIIPSFKPTNAPTSFPTQAPPKLLSAVYSDDGHSIIVKLTSASDLGITILNSLISKSWTCSLIFSFPSANLSSCVWNDAFTVTISLPVARNIPQPGVEKLYL